MPSNRRRSGPHRSVSPSTTYALGQSITFGSWQRELGFAMVDDGYAANVRNGSKADIRRKRSADLSAAVINHPPKAFSSAPESNLPNERGLDLRLLTKGWAMRTLVQIIRCERGANAIEYALVASLIAIAAFAAFENLGNRVDAMYNNVSNHL
jgi:pilus assembly protein Flp/PilA